MLSEEGNAGERWKTTMGLISKKEPLHVQHTFLDISLPLFCMVTTWNFQKRFYGGNGVRVLVHFFFTGAQFLFTFVADSISHFIPAATKFRYTFWVAIPINRVILHWYACVTDGRSGVLSRDYQIFSELSPRESSAKEQELPKKWYIGQQGYLPLSVSMDIWWAPDVFKWKCQNRFVAYKTLNCKTVRVFAYWSTREWSNNRAWTKRG